VKSDSKEAEHFGVSGCFSDKTIMYLTRFVQINSIELVFNPREVGTCELENRQSENIIIPMSLGEQMRNHEINRKLKHISAIGCISVAEESLIWYIIAW
jgi:hypothetical protein